MTIVYNDYGVIRTKEVPAFTVVHSYIMIGEQYLLGEAGGRIHISQLVQKEEDGKEQNVPSK